MSNEIVKYAFVSGEVSPTLFGRSDLEKYDLGLAEAQNWFVDYRGGLSTRPGTQLVDYVQHDDRPTKFVAFKFAPNLPNTYVILFGHEYIRFIQDGAYVLEDPVAITGITKALSAVVTSAAHGLSTGNWLYLTDVVGMTEVNDRLFEVVVISVNSFRLLDPFGNGFSTLAATTYTSGGFFSRVYTLDSPYEAEDLPTLRAYQRRDLIRLTHNDFEIRNLVRNDATDWELEIEELGNTVGVPTNLDATASAVGTASVGFMVTAISADGVESQPSRMHVEETIVNYAVTSGSITFTWDKVEGAQYYNVYRTNILPGAGTGTAVTLADQVGFLGRAYGPSFTDANIVPNFAITPPRYDNPFADAEILSIEVTNGGTGYDKTATVTVAGLPGSGFLGYPVVDDSGVIISVVVIKGGSDYVSPVVSFAGGGSGATATAEVGPASGNNPAVSSVFQQRQIYAATLNQPLTVFGGRPGQLSCFDTSNVTSQADALELDIESEEVAPIRHLLAMRGGLLMMTQSGIWQLHGSGQDEAISITNAISDPQSYRGCSNVPPLTIDTDLLYIEGKGLTVRLLSYNDLAKVYAGQNVSILSNHLFASDNQIVAWGYAQNPYNLIWAAREDGALLVFTLVKEQDVFAWTPCYTKGLVQDVMVVQEGNVDSVYLMVKRLINGRWTKFIERVAQREIENVEEAWCVDCGLEYPQIYPDATLTPGAVTGIGVVFTASSGVFEVGWVGAIIRVGGGKARIDSRTNASTVVCTIIRDLTATIPEDESDTPREALSGTWTVGIPVDEISGLDHLEGETVQILADGNVLTPQVVTDGTISLGVEASKITIGLKFTCVAKTLSPVAADATIEARRKKMLGVAVRLHDSRGIKAGASLDKLYEMKERTTEPYAEPIQLQRSHKWALMKGTWTKEGQTYFVQDQPLPATILGLVQDLEVGDDIR